MSGDGLMSGGEYNSYFAAIETVSGMFDAIMGQVNANKYVRPALVVEHDDVVVEEQHTDKGWRLWVYGGLILALVVGGLVIWLRKPGKK